jgi:hypothetical protein
MCIRGLKLDNNKDVLRVAQITPVWFIQEFILKRPIKSGYSNAALASTLLTKVCH